MNETQEVLFSAILASCVIFLLIEVQNKARIAHGSEPDDCHSVRIFNTEGSTDGLRLLVIAGMHGNEPAPSHAAHYLIKEMLIAKGHVRWIPEANWCGIAKGERHLSGVPDALKDLNKNFSVSGCRGRVAEAICSHIEWADVVLDCHEGWGFSHIHKTSMGSSIVPNKYANDLAVSMVEEINTYIEKDWQHFQLLTDVPSPKGTLRNYCTKKKKPYILLETTGQNDVQPLKKRKAQVILAIKHLCFLLDIQ